MRRRTCLVIPGMVAAGVTVRPVWSQELAAPEPVVVVAGNSPLPVLNRSQAVGYFTGRLRKLPNGDPIQPLDLPANHPLRERFYRLLTGLGPAQMNSYWARLSFSGQMQPPQVVDTEASMLRSLRDNPRAIGYLAKPPSDERLRVLLVLGGPAA